MERDSSFLSNALWFAKYTDFWKARRLRSFVLLPGAPCTWIWILSIDGITLTGQNRSNRRKSCTSATVSTRGLTRTHLGSKRDLRVDRPASNHSLKKWIQLKSISRHSSYRAVLTICVGQRTNELQFDVYREMMFVVFCESQKEHTDRLSGESAEFLLLHLTAYIRTVQYMHTYTHTYIHNTYIHIHTFIYIYIYICIHTYVHTVRISTYIHTYTHTHIQKYIHNTYTYIHIYIVYVHTYTHTHTYRHSILRDVTAQISKVSYRSLGAKMSVFGCCTVAMLRARESTALTCPSGWY